MITPLLLCSAFVRQEPRPAGPLLSKMLAKYLTAESGAYRIVTVQSAQGVSLTTTTVLQWTGNKLHLKQSRGGSEPRMVSVLSDGVTFAYDRPQGALGPKRYVEKVTQNGVVQTRQDLYVAARESLVERSPVLDILLASREDVKSARALWSAMDLDGPRTVKGRTGEKAKGKFRLHPAAAWTGDLEMIVAEDGTLLRYATRQTVIPPPESGVKDPIEVLTVTDVEEIAPDPARYTIDG